jgi:hypothetical protein
MKWLWATMLMLACIAVGIACAGIIHAAILGHVDASYHPQRLYHDGYWWHRRGDPTYHYPSMWYKAILSGLVGLVYAIVFVFAWAIWWDENK